MPDVIINGPEGRIEGALPPRPRRHGADGAGAAPASAAWRDDEQQGRLRALPDASCAAGFRPCASISAASGAARAASTAARASLPMPPRRSIGCRPTTRTPASCWVAGFSFGAWIGMQLLMRRPEIESFISVAPPANMYDFTFLAPCPSSGLILQGDQDIGGAGRIGAEAGAPSCRTSATSRSIFARSPAPTIIFADRLDALVDPCRRLYRRPRPPRRARPPASSQAAAPADGPREDASIGEGVAHQHGVVALGARRQQRDRRADQLLEPADVFDRGRRQIGPGARAAGAFAATPRRSRRPARARPGPSSRPGHSHRSRRRGDRRCRS